ncbi:DUF4440 domain-containing protein [Erythrobacter ani]|uniref:Nuclear transport factor 2 family protein n=1 Tax=Erythrobacter ani TaxID=2827235 RepID=A0ABS6SLL4_9SPHN|nr:DUF4440 domain-containing protein [Erythrobacter ani]MBV7265875.1 nuclear transport factor 2 family protein [Erythrobacter ani]
MAVAGFPATALAEKTQKQVASQLEELDARLFEAAFESCQIDIVSGLISDNIEFYHDRDGLSYTGHEAFIADVARDCETGSAGGKRVLVPGSISTHMIGEFGAMQMGVHEFHQIMPDGESIPRERGSFIHLWERKNSAPSGWQISRIISYDHEGVEPG